MFELIIEGISVPLLPGASLSLEINTGIFDYQVVRGVKSLPITLPVTRESDLIFGGVNKLQSGGNRRKTYSAELVAHGSLILKGKFKLSKPTHNSYPGYLVAAAGTLQQQIGDTRLRSLDLGSTTFTADYAQSRIYFTQVPEQNNWTASNQFKLFWSKGGPTGYYGSYYAMYDGNVSSTLSYLAAQLNADIENTHGDIAHVTGNVLSIIVGDSQAVNITAVSVLVGIPSGSSPGDINYTFLPVSEKHTRVHNTDDFVFPLVYNPELYPNDKGWNGYVNQIVTPGTSEYTAYTAAYGPGPHYLQNISDKGPTKYSLVPMLFLKPFLQKIFELAQMDVSGILFSDPELESLLVYSNTTLDEQATYELFGFRPPYPGIDFGHVKDTILHANYLPDLTIGEYLNQIRIPFNLGYFFDVRSNTVQIIPLRDIINAECELDWTDRVVPTWEQDLTDETTYVLSFSEDSSDAVFKDNDAQLASITLASDSIPAGTEVATQTIESKVAPLPNKTHGARQVPYARHRATTPLFGKIKTDLQPRLLFWHGLANDNNGKAYPKASNMSPDGSYSLQWNGEKGLYQTFWKDWIAFLKRTRPIEIPVTLRPEDLSSFDPKAKVHIRGNDYLIEKLEISLPLKDQNPGKLTAWRC